MPYAYSNDLGHIYAVNSVTEVPDGYTFSTTPPVLTPTSAQLLAAYQSQALSALSDSDTTILRCYENSVAVPQAWADYRKDLRAALKATEVGTLPTRPSYPAGT